MANQSSTPSNLNDRSSSMDETPSRRSGMTGSSSGSTAGSGGRAGRRTNAAGFSNRLGENLNDHERRSLREATREEGESNIEDIANDLRERASRMATDFSARANQFYGEATDWLDQNRSRALMTVGLIAAVGIAGFLVARSSRRGEEWSSSKDRAAS